jgi:uncharacterized protein (TIRG00374 family)
LADAPSRHLDTPPAAGGLHQLGRVRPWLKLALGIALLLGLGWHIDWQPTWQSLLRSDPTLVLGAVAVLTAALLASTEKWARLARLACGPLPWWGLLRAYWIGSFASNYLPSNVGGDVVRVLVLAPPASLASLTASVLAERLTGLAVLTVLSAGCLLLGPPMPAELSLALWLLVAALCLVMALVWLGGPRLIRAGAARLPGRPRFLARIAGKLVRLAEALHAYRSAPGALALALAWSVAFYLLLALFQLAVLRAVGSTIDLGQVMLVAPLVPLVSLLPVTANGLGLAEGAFVLFYMQLGVPGEQALAAALLRRIVSVTVSAPGGVLWLVKRAS